jgi:hypothetical protein
MGTILGPPTASLTPQQIATAAYRAGFRGSDLSIITAISLAESGGGVPNAFNPTDPDGGSFGVSQINGSHAPNGSPTAQWVVTMLDPQKNLDEAYQVAGGGSNFSPWSTYTGGAYVNYLPQATTAASEVENGQYAAVPPGPTSVAGIRSIGSVLFISPGATGSEKAGTAGSGVPAAGASTGGLLNAISAPFKRDLLLFLEFAAGVGAVYFGISHFSSVPSEVAWVLLWGGALLVYSAIKLQSVTCILDNAVTGGTTSCKLQTTGGFIEGLGEALALYLAAKGIGNAASNVLGGGGGGEKGSPSEDVETPTATPDVFAE